MTIAERKGLTPARILINNEMIVLELFENSDRDLYLSCNSSEPKGTVYFGTTPSLLCAFLERSITLQCLFDHSPSQFVEIKTENKTAVYSRNDIEVKLTYGEQSVDQLGHASMIEIWKS